MSLDLNFLRELVQLMRDHQVAEIEHVDGAAQLRVSMAGGRVAAEPVPAVMSHAVATPLAKSSSDFIVVTSPLVGTFYRSPSPDASAFVELGSAVRKGQTVCIVEAMKLMNEVETESEGIVAEVLVENGSRVEYGQPLFHLRRS